MLKTNYDVIVIGAGCGGLTAAICAAKEGKNVLLLERSNTAGGFVNSFVRGRFEFDISTNQLCGLTQEAGLGELRRLFDHINVTDKVSWSPLKDAYRVITKSTDGSDIDATMPFGIDKFINRMEYYVPGSKASIKTLFDIGEEIEKAVSEIEKINGQPTRKDVRGVMKEFSSFISTAPYSANEVFKAIGIPSKAIDILNGFWTHFGIDCDRLSFTHYASYLYTYIKYGSFIPSDTGTALVNAMVDEFTSNGGTIRFNSQVNRILYRDGSVTGVILKDGTEIYCNHIISSVSPTTTYAKLMKAKNVPVSAVKRTNARTFGARYACVYLGLNRSIKDLGIKDYSVYYNETADTASLYNLMKTIKTNNSLRAVCPNIINSDASPDGTTILCLSTIYTDNCWADIAPEEYFEEKDMLAARLIANYESATGITIHNSIEELEVVTPVTFARYTSSPQGVTHGYLADDWDGIIPRIMTEESDNDIKGLRFCSAWGTQLNGINSVVATGRNAAYATLCDIIEEGGNAQ